MRGNNNKTIFFRLLTGILFPLFIALSHPCASQSNRIVDSLNSLFAESKTAARKVGLLNAIVDQYYTVKSFKQGDSVLSLQLQIAKDSKDNDLLLRTYFTNSINTITSWATKEDFERTTAFLRQGIHFAETQQDHKYLAIGYARLAGILRKRGELDSALQYAQSAKQHFDDFESDSVKAIVFIELGDCYQKKTEQVEACKSFNEAYDLALKSDIHSLESSISLRLANLYYLLGDTIEAKRQVYQSVLVNKKSKTREKLIDDYTMLGRVTDNPAYIDTVFSMADEMHLQDKTFIAKKILLAIYGFVQKDPLKALNYINTNRDIKDNLMKGGVANYHFYLGQLFRYGNMPDSALYYLRLAEPGILRDFGISLAKFVYQEMAVCYEQKNDPLRSIFYYEKMLAYSENEQDRTSMASVSNSLSKLYRLTGQFEKAYDYKVMATDLQDSLQSSAKEKDLVLLDIDRETKKHEEDRRREEALLERKHNLQYLGITIAVCILFIFLLILGMFPLSKMVIKILGYVYFIALFEFIILLIEHNVLQPITHGDPLKLWMIKILVIALLVPIQQFVEHRTIRLLESRKLHKARKQLANNLSSKKKKTTRVPTLISDADAGVL